MRRREETSDEDEVATREVTAKEILFRVASGSTPRLTIDDLSIQSAHARMVSAKT